MNASQPEVGKKYFTLDEANRIQDNATHVNDSAMPMMGVLNQYRTPTSR